MKDIRRNGLYLHRVKSQYYKVEVRNSIINFIQEHFKNDGFIVAWKYYEVLLGYFRQGKCVFYDSDRLIEDNFLQKLRVFNESKEIYVWRNSNNFYARIRDDSEGIETYVVDACQVIWGTQSNCEGEFTKLSEERGIELYIPVKNANVDNKNKRLFIKTRNYIGFTPNEIATYIDCRFLGFTDSYFKEE